MYDKIKFVKKSFVTNINCDKENCLQKKIVKKSIFVETYCGNLCSKTFILPKNVFGTQNFF